MRLLVVYGIKTGDHDYFRQFYPSRRLSEECANRSIPLRFLFPGEVAAFLAKYSARQNTEKMAETVCLIRGVVPTDTVRQLETAGFRCVNSSKASILANDKLETARFLEHGGWPTPRTVPLAEASRRFGPEDFPLVAKPRFGSRGQGVCLVNSAGELAELAACTRTPENTGSPPDESDYIIQEYVESSAGRDLRVFFAGNRIIAIAERRSQDGSFVSNACTGGKMTVPPYGTELPESWKKMTRDIIAASGLWYGTVDFLYATNDQPVTPASRQHCENTNQAELNLTVCELNTAPGFEALEKDCGFNIAGMLIDSLVADFV